MLQISSSLDSFFETADSEELRKNFSAFVKKSFITLNPSTPYHHNWHIDCCAEYAVACFNREIKRLIVNIPPGQAKSTQWSAALPAWILGKRSHERFIGVSNAEELTNRNSRWTKKIIQSDWYPKVFPETKLIKDTESFFETTAGGFRQSFTTMGSVTGNRGNYLCFDDFLSVHMIRSDVDREKALWLYDNAFSNRLNDEMDDVIIVIEQRLHEKDLTGKLISENQGFTHLCLPAEFEEKTYFYMGNFSKTVEVGELLDPKRLSRELLQQKKDKIVDEQTGVANARQMYAAQYQQNPIADGGNMLQLSWFKRYKPFFSESVVWDTVVVSADTAQKPEELHDPSAFTKWGIKDNFCYLLDTVNQRGEYPETKRRLLSFCDQSPQPDYLLVEDHSTGSSIIQEFKRETRYAVIPMKTKGIKKEIRFSNCTGQIASGNVFLPERADWLFEYENQLMKFPMGKNDDLCDSTSQFLNWFKNRAASFEFFEVDLF